MRYKQITLLKFSNFYRSKSKKRHFRVVMKRLQQLRPQFSARTAATRITNINTKSSMLLLWGLCQFTLLMVLVVVITCNDSLLYASASSTAGSSNSLPRSPPSIPRRLKSHNQDSATSDDDDSELSSLSRSSLPPPWNPTSLINETTGLLKDIYQRIPGEWEKEYRLRRTQNTIIPSSSTITTTMSSSSEDSDTQSQYCQIRQVPGDGNCLFHSISVGLNYVMNHTHYDLSRTTTTIKPPSSSSSDMFDTNDNTDAPPVTVVVANDHRPTRYFMSGGGGTTAVTMTTRSSRRQKRRKPTLDDLYLHSQYLRDECVKYLRSGTTTTGSTGSRHRGKKKLYLQGREYIYSHELIDAAAQQYNISSIEYCNTMAEDCVWGGGPEIVVLCNVLQRPIHVYELITSTSTTTATTTPATAASTTTSSYSPGSSNNDEAQLHSHDSQPTTGGSWTLPYYPNSQLQQQRPAFVLRRIACFGSPKYDYKKAIHILSADSRFPDVRPGKQLTAGNHFLAVFPLDDDDNENHDDDDDSRQRQQQQQQQEHRNRHQQRKRIRGGDSSTSTTTDNAIDSPMTFEPMTTVRRFVTQYIEWWQDITDQYFC